MTDAEIDQLIQEIDQLAQRVGCRFVPDPDKLMAFRCAQREERAMREHYRKEIQRRHAGSVRVSTATEGD